MVDAIVKRTLLEKIISTPFEIAIVVRKNDFY